MLLQKDGRPAPGASYDEVVRITAKYTEARPEIIRLGFPFQDRNGRLLAPDIGASDAVVDRERIHEADHSFAEYRGYVIHGRGRQGGSGAVSHSREVLFMGMRYLNLAVVVLALGLAGPLAALPASALEVGQKAPDFTVVAPGNKQIKLSDMLGKGPVVVYTFIQAFTAT